MLCMLCCARGDLLCFVRVEGSLTKSLLSSTWLQVQTALGAIVREASVRDLPCGVFGSFGWSGEAVDELENRLKVLTYCVLFCACAVLCWGVCCNVCAVYCYVCTVLC